MIPSPHPILLNLNFPCHSTTFRALPISLSNILICFHYTPFNVPSHTPIKSCPLLLLYHMILPDISTCLTFTISSSDPPYPFLPASFYLLAAQAVLAFARGDVVFIFSFKIFYFLYRTGRYWIYFTVTICILSNNCKQIDY